jgi:hypothetical protein
MFAGIVLRFEERDFDDEGDIIPIATSLSYDTKTCNELKEFFHPYRNNFAYECYIQDNEGFQSKYIR